MQRPLIIVSSVLLSAVAVSASPLHAPLTSRTIAQIPGYDSAGCYTEATGMRALTGSAFFDDAMTVEKCTTACQGFKYFGVEYGRECYCGNTLNPGSEKANIADCSFSCPGNSAENCGAGNRLNVYIRSQNPAPSNPTVYSSRGCFAEPSNSRALTGKTSASDDMTVQKCADICSAAGFSLFGLEYYHECYCGNNLSSGSVQAPSSDCKFSCAGNSKELCGGDWRLNLYQFGYASSSASSTSSSSSTSPTLAPTTYSSEGCYTEINPGRALSAVSYYDDAMTINKCATACSAYTWFGVEYGRECFCGNTIDKGSVKTSISECNFPCPGKSSETCGAGNRLNMYRNGPAQATSSSTTTTTSSAVPTTSSTTALTTTSTTSTTTSATSTPTSTRLTTTSTTTSTTSSTTASTTTLSVVPSSSSSTTTSVLSSTQSSSTTFSTTTSSSGSSSSTSSASTSPASSTTASSTTSSVLSTTVSPTSSLTTTTTAALTTTTTTTTSATTTTTTTTTSQLPACATPVFNPDFEGDGSPWTIKIPNAPYVTYNLNDPDAAHSGSKSASITYRQGTPGYQSWFNQPVTLCPNTLYNFNAYVKSSNNYPGCTVYFYIGSSDGASVKKIMTSTPYNLLLNSNWVKVTGTYQSDNDVQLTFNVRTTCSNTNIAKTYYMDDISFAAAA